MIKERLPKVAIGIKLSCQNIIPCSLPFVAVINPYTHAVLKFLFFKYFSVCYIALYYFCIICVLAI